MKKSELLVPNFVLVQLISVTNASPPIAMPLLIHGEASMLFAPVSAVSMYSPKMIAMIAALPGFKTVTAHHVNRNPAHSPNILLKYTCAPPFNGIAPPNSAYEAAPVQASKPAIAQTMSAAPRDPALELTAAGEEKMPEPMIKPTTSESPFKKVKLLFLSKLCWAPDSKPWGVPGVPSGAYPPAPEALRGKSALLKSKALETEKLRLSMPGSGRAEVGVVSSSKDSSLELGAPEEEDSSDSRRPSSL